jgi:phosphatidylserine decarboxylase
MKREHPVVMREGWPFIATALVLSAIAGGAGFGFAAGVALVLSLFCAWFFRNPSRVIPVEKGAIVSPGDGKVLAVEAVDDPRWVRGPATKVSVFLNVLDVHVNRTPIGGKVVDIDYRPGKFLVASLDKASEENERNAVCIEDEQGRRVAFMQIAGLIARRVVSYLRLGDELERGEVMGLIRFGSRVEVLFSRSARVVVRPGERVRGGSTVVAWFP